MRLGEAEVSGHAARTVVTRFRTAQGDRAPDALPSVQLARYCAVHDVPAEEVCPMGHPVTEWDVRNVRTGELVEQACLDDGSENWCGYAPR